MDRYAPTRKLTKKEIQLKQKPWITSGIRKSIYQRDKLLKQSTNSIDEVNFFTSIADKIRKDIPPVFNNFKQYLKTPLANSFYFNPVTTTEMMNTINSLNSNKASGPYSIPNSILFLVQHDIAKILTKIINLTFQTGIFPSSLKLVKVIPIFKNKGSNTNFNNYRPISLLSNVDKIFEKLVHSRVISFLDRYNILYRKQFGFRKKHSTAHSLISLTEEIRNALDSGRFSCGVFIDL